MCGPFRHHKCPKCSMLLPKPIENLNSHICQNTSLDWTILTGQKKQDSKKLAPNLESSKRKYKCEICSKGYQNRAGLVKHQKIKKHKISCLQLKEEIVNENRLDFKDLKQDPLEIQPEFKSSENSFEYNSLKEFNESKKKPIESREAEMFSENSYESFDKPAFDEKTNENSEKNCMKEPAKKPIVVSMNDLYQGASMNGNPLKTQLHECSKCEFKTKIKSELKTHKMSIHAPIYTKWSGPDRKFNCTSSDFRYSLYIRTVTSKLAFCFKPA